MTTGRPWATASTYSFGVDSVVWSFTPTRPLSSVVVTGGDVVADPEVVVVTSSPPPHPHAKTATSARMARKAANFMLRLDISMPS